MAIVATSLIGPFVIFTSNRKAKKNLARHALVKRLRWPLPDALKHVEQLGKGKLVELEIDSSSNASDIAREMVELGVICHVEP